MAPIIAYHFPPSSPSRLAILAIRNLNLDVELREINLFEKEQLNDDFIKLNPQHCVPTINDDGFILWESRAIAIYLVEKNHPGGHALYPLDAQRRAVINQRLQFDANTLHPRIRAICYPALFLGETRITDEKREKLNEALEWVNSFLEGNQYVAGGDSPTLADLSILVSVTTFVNIGGDVTKYKNVADWYARCKTLPGFEENNDGGKIFGERVRSHLVDTL